MKNVGLKLFKYMLIHFEQSNYDVIINNYEMTLEAHENDFGTKRMMYPIAPHQAEVGRS